MLMAMTSYLAPRASHKVDGDHLASAFVRHAMHVKTQHWMQRHVQFQFLDGVLALEALQSAAGH